MNKTLKKLLVATLACVTLCGTTFAAPRGGKKHAPVPAPRHQVVNHAKPKHHAPPKHTHHRPAPKPHHHVKHTVHHHCDNNNGLVTLGAAIVGGLVGGVLGAW